MMKPKHTPGEWKSKDHGYDLNEIFAGDLLIAKISNVPPDKEELANTKLIVQSPAMYDFLAEYVDAMNAKKSGGSNLTTHEKALFYSANQILKSIK